MNDQITWLPAGDALENCKYIILPFPDDIPQSIDENRLKWILVDIISIRNKLATFRLNEQTQILIDAIDKYLDLPADKL